MISADCAAGLTVLTPAPAAPRGRPLYVVPPDEQADFARLCPLVTERERINLMLVTLEELGPRPPRGRLVRDCKRLARESGFSWFEIYTAHRHYHPLGDWRALRDRRKRRADDAGVSLPAEFLAYWRGLCLQNQRASAPAWRVLIRAWRKWLCGEGPAIPGYAACPPPGLTGRHPAGWSYDNLMKHAPSEYELTLARQGPMAAAACLPPVLTTRVGLSVGSVYLFDDLERDFLVGVAGERGARRLLQISAFDFFSASNFARGYKPVRLDEESGRMIKLRETETLFLLASVLIGFGYHPRGTRLNFERGTSTVGEDKLALLSKWTGGRWDAEAKQWVGGVITWRKAGVFGRPLIKGLYHGQAKGNPKHKARLESHHNINHNEAASIAEFPGQKGRRYDLAPEELYGRSAYYEKLLERAKDLPPDVRARLAAGFLDAMEAMRRLDEMHERIDNRTEHELEGWREAGLFKTVWREAPDQLWRDEEELFALAAVNPAQFHATLSKINADERLRDSRRLSPREVRLRGSAELVRLPPECAVGLLWESFVIESEPLANYQLRVPEMGEYGAAGVFEGWLVDPAGARRPLENGKRYRIFPNFQDPSRALVCSPSGELLGQAARWQVPQPTDDEALRRDAGRVTALAKSLRPNYDRVFGELAAQQRADHAWNDALIARAATPAQADARTGHRLPPAASDAQARAAKRARLARMARTGATAEEIAARAAAEITQ